MNKRMLKGIWLFAGILSFVSIFATVSVAEPSDKLIKAIIQQESGGRDNVIGDKTRKNKAYGCLQVRQPCVDDINVHYGTKYKAEQCFGNRKLSIWIFRQYMAIYATSQRLGHKPTDEDYSRIWNGGLNGNKKEATIRYWASVSHLMR